MIAVAGLWELGWNTPIVEHDIWETMLRDFNVGRWYMAPVSGIFSSRVIEVPGIEEALVANPDMTAIFCDERADTALREFRHPENALYVFGRSTYNPLLTHRRGGDLAVRIETPGGSKGLLWAYQAAAIVLYDRFLKVPQWR